MHLERKARRVLAIIERCPCLGEGWKIVVMDVMDEREKKVSLGFPWNLLQTAHCIAPS
jgi:hypothetical protein